ncbi:peptide-methionine (R)-S-oxide reductase MsrB [Alkalilimnicola ehrlichii MLHE-1]|nr:peptide-methionine (R)-S-oxide reductase MsrB [Alkalilimnicola ehrlichii]
MQRRDFLILTLGTGASLLLPVGAAMGRLEVREFHRVTGRAWDLGTLAHDPAFWRAHVPHAAWRILFRGGTERPFSSPLDERYEDGTYVCAACHLPLFSSDTKFDSRTGWPSFYQPFPGHVGTKQDRLLWMVRTEYHCIRCRGHQGHVFEDGPAPTGRRWCNNGLALRFAPATGHADDEERATALFAGGCFWCVEEAFDGGGQFCDRSTFYPAEEYHQNYYQKNPLRYRFYVTRCGRYARLDQLWGSEARPGKD